MRVCVCVRAGRAMPLYERALGIYEAHYGPEHPEVAHTLTDLAVLHLEQVRNTDRHTHMHPHGLMSVLSRPRSAQVAKAYVCAM